MTLKIGLLFLLFVWTSEGQKGEGCSKGFQSGVCKSLYQCQSAIDDIMKNKIFPVNCGFEGDEPLVCCFGEKLTPQPTAPPTTKAPPSRPVATTQRPSGTTTEYVPPLYDYTELEETPQCQPIPANMTSPRTGRKAWDMCIEYQEKYVFPCAPSPALTGGKVRTNNCKHNANKLVVGGEDASEAEFPHMALLGFGPEDQISFLCGGSVISDRFIVTAGHCTYTKDFGAVSFALLGTLKRSDNYDKSNLYDIVRIVKHPDYKPPQRYNDIALLETGRTIRLYLHVVPACLDTGVQSAEQALATGWGATTNRGSNADTLQKVKLFRFTDEECSQSIRPYRLMKKGIDTKTQICYGDKTQSKDTCQGDSGGPMQIKSDHINCMYVIVGVTSFGRQCGVVGEPGIYTRVAEYVPWIESIVWPV